MAAIASSTEEPEARTRRAVHAGRETEPGRGISRRLPTMTDPGSDATPSAREIGIEDGRILAVVDWHSYLHLAIGVLLLLVVTGFARSATDSLTKIVIAGVLALALDRPVRMLQDRGMSRGAGTGVVAVVFVYPWAASRSLWAPWIPHTLGDVIVDSILEF